MCQLKMQVSCFSFDLIIMDYHTASLTEFAYKPEYLTCNLTFYSDVQNRNTNGLFVVRIHNDPRSMKLMSGISSNDLSAYYLSDLINLLNMDENGYKEIAKRHKKVTGEFNLIDYEELQQVYECVDDLSKMTRRLQIMGTSSLSILNDDRKLFTAVCVEGHVCSPDRVFVPRSHFFDNKIHSADAIAEFLVTNSRQHITTSVARTYRYGLGGSAIYVLIYKVNGVFNYLVYLSEEPISHLVQALVDQAEFVTGFDFVYTVVGRTICDEESCPYIETPDGVYFKDVVLYPNENRFSLPLLSYLNAFKMLTNAEQLSCSESEDNGDELSRCTSSRSLPPLSSLFGDDVKNYNSTDETLFAALVKNHRHRNRLTDQIRNIGLEDSSLYYLSDDDLVNRPLQYAFEIGKHFIMEHLGDLDSMLVRDFLRSWYNLTSDEKIKHLENELEGNSLNRLPRWKSAHSLSRPYSTDVLMSTESLNDGYETETESRGIAMW